MSTDPPESRRDRDAPEPDDAEILADVFNRFSLDSDRRTRRHARTSHRWGNDRTNPPRSSHQEAPWPASDTDLSQANTDDHPQRPEDNDLPATYIRSYAWTGGRTRSNYRFELETLVSTSEMCQNYHLERLEHQCIADLCRHPRSVAEVGALLSVPLGVAKVLLGDMADLGLITVHHTVTKHGSTSHLMLMERVLSGLRRL